MNSTERLTLIWLVSVLIFLAIALNHDWRVEQARLDAGIYPSKQKVSGEVFHWRSLGDSQSDE